MKKLISLILALAVSGAFFIPAFAEDFNATTNANPQPAPDSTQPELIVVSSEIIMSDISELQAPASEVITADPEPPEDNNGAGVSETPIRKPVTEGNGTLLEDVTDDDINRQFITVRSKGGNIFYIVIDYDNNRENVYFLNAVDDFDLLSFSENFPDGVLEAYEELQEEAARIETEKAALEAGQAESKAPAKPVNDDETEENGLDIQRYVTIGIAVLFLGGIVYFKFIKGKKGGGKPNKNNRNNYDDEESEDDDE